MPEPITAESERLWDISMVGKSFAGEQKLSRPMVMAFIENVYIYEPNRIEIVFQHEDEIARLVESQNEQSSTD